MTLPSDASLYELASTYPRIGGDYYNPISEFRRVARQLDGRTLPTNASSLPMQVDPAAPPTHVTASLLCRITSLLFRSELPFGLYRRSTYDFAALLVDAKGLFDFEIQVHAGHLARVGFFAVAQRDATRGLAREFTP